MGIDRRRFKSEINNGYVCPLCKSVFEDPVMVTKCQENFCKNCLDQWLDGNSKCPGKCGKEIGKDEAIRNKTLENFMSHLLVSCEFASLGCQQIVALISLPIHTDECCHNPKVTQTCFGGCGAELNKQQFSRHNCVDVLNEKFNQLKIEFKKELKKINKKLEIFEKPEILRKMLYFNSKWLKLLLIYRETNRQCVEHLKQEFKIDDDEWWTIKGLLMTKNPDFAKREDGSFDSEILTNYFKLLVPNVLLNIASVTGDVLVNHSETFLIDCSRLIVGITGFIFATESDEYGDDEDIILVKIDYGNKKMLSDEKEISKNFDCIIESIDLGDDSVEWLVSRLNSKGKMLLLDPLVGRERNRFCLIEKLEDGSVKKDNWEVVGTAVGAAGN